MGSSEETRTRPRLFDAYLFNDWSANSKAKTGPDSLWVAEGWFDSSGVLVVGEPENPSTRFAAERLIAGRLRAHVRAGRRTLVGFDFPLGYPASALARLVHPGAGWRDLWKLLEGSISDGRDNQNDRFEVASELNRKVGERWYWGCPKSPKGRALPMLAPTMEGRGEVTNFRVVESSLREGGLRPHSVWQLLGNGAVGSQSLVGLPLCERLRADRELDLVVWPFETGFAVPGRDRGSSVLVEIWPGVIEVDVALHPIKDAAQMLSLVRWAAANDAQGGLGAHFVVPGLARETRRRAEREEGWILGWGPRGG